VADLPAKPRCVFDCMVFLQAAVSRHGPAFALLTLVEAGRLELLVSREILAELREVLVRPAVRRKFPLLSADFVDAFVDRLESLATPIESVPPLFQFTRDPDDEPYINLAVARRAEYLVTRDRDLLDLAGQKTPEARELERIHPGLKILDPIMLLREVAATLEP